MKAFFVAQLRIKSDEKFKEYSINAAKTISDHGGEVLIRGSVLEHLNGEFPFNLIAVVTFPDATKLQHWFKSEEYQSLIPLRDEASDMLLTGFKAL